METLYITALTVIYLAGLIGLVIHQEITAEKQRRREAIMRRRLGCEPWFKVTAGHVPDSHLHLNHQI